MSYDMNRLKQAIDAQIPAPEADELLIRGIAFPGKGRGVRLSKMLSAAAAVIVLILAFVSLLPEGPGPDRVGGPLSSGGSSVPDAAAKPTEIPLPVQTSAPMPADLTVVVEDMSLYQAWYSPMWGASMFPDEAEFDHVVIRKQEDGSFVFEKKTGGEALPGQWQQAFAYFVTSGVGLVGDGEGMALLGKDGLITDFIYESLEYMGNRVAFVSMKEGCEGYVPGLSMICIVDGAPLSDEHYDEIGYTGDGDTTLFMGVCREMIKGEDGGLISDRILYTDVMDATGRVIVRCHELSHVYEGVLGVRMEETGGILLIDMDGNQLYGGRTFDMLGARKNGLQIVHDAGVGVLDEDGGWLIDPGTYSSIRFGENDTFLVTDYEDVTREINRQGEDVSSASLKARMWLKQTLTKINNWLDTFGLLGKITMLAAAWFFLVRLGHAQKTGEIRHMLITEAGWAALIFGLLLISHRDTWKALSLWPTDTDTTGAYRTAWLYGISAIYGLVSMIGVWKRLRKPRRTLILGTMVLLLPWAFKAFCADMSVANWRTLSVIVFGVYLVLVIVLTKAGFIRRFMDWCRTLDSLNEYSRWRRVVWYVLTLAAIVNFAAGTWLSGQEIVNTSASASVLKGGGSAYDAEWIENINDVSADWRASDLEITEFLTDGNWAVIQTVNWMEQNGVDRLTGDMLYRLSVDGTLELRREGTAQMYFSSDEPGVRFLTMNSPVAKDGQIHADSVLLVAPSDGPMPEIRATLSVMQPQIDWFASQRYYEVSLGTVLQDMGGAEGEGVQPFLGVSDASDAIIGGADSPTSIFVQESSRSVIGGADAPTPILVK